MYNLRIFLQAFPTPSIADPNEFKGHSEQSMISPSSVLVPVFPSDEKQSGITSEPSYAFL